MCSGSALRIYLEYINITLKDVIIYRKECKHPFSADEVMLVIQNSIKAYKFLKSK
jgi:hypothetical protein